MGTSLKGMQQVSLLPDLVMLKNDQVQSFYLAANTFLSGIVDSHNLKPPCILVVSSVKPDTFLLAEPNKFPTLSSYTLRSTEAHELRIPEEWRYRMKGDLGIRFKVYVRQACKIKVLVHFRPPRLEAASLMPVLPKAIPRRIQDFEWDEFLDFQVYRPIKKKRKRVEQGSVDHVQSNITELNSFDKISLLSKFAEGFKKVDHQRTVVLAKKEKAFLTKQLAVFKSVLRREIKENEEVEKLNQSLAVEIKSAYKKYMFNSFWTFMVLADIEERLWKAKVARVCMRSKARPGYKGFLRLLKVIRIKQKNLSKQGKMRQTLKTCASLLSIKVKKEAEKISFVFLKEFFFADAARRSFLLYVARGRKC